MDESTVNRLSPVLTHIPVSKPVTVDAPFNTKESVMNWTEEMTQAMSPLIVHCHTTPHLHCIVEQ
jgi:hypothetical protein